MYMARWSCLVQLAAFCLSITAVAGWEKSNVTFFAPFSALHDPVEGSVRIFAEGYPSALCTDITLCEFPDLSHESTVVASTWSMGKQLEEGYPEPLACFVTCKLPPDHAAADLSSVVLRDADRSERAVMHVERIQTLVKKKGVGMCVGPVFSDVPHFMDWVDHHSELGVEGIHIYLALVDKTRSFDVFHRSGPGHGGRVTVANHHLITWMEYTQAEPDLPSIYYSQTLMENECTWRYRQVYEFILYIDRDEFVHVNGVDRRSVDLAGMFRARTGGTVFASAALFTAVYHVHCPTVEVTAVRHDKDRPGRDHHDAHAHHEGAEGHSVGHRYQTYLGYNVWKGDTRQPDFFNCSSDWFGQIHKAVGVDVLAQGRQCHTKSVVRPLVTERQGTHYVMEAKEGYQDIPIPIDPTQMYLKHIRCIPGEDKWEDDLTKGLCPRTDPVDYSKDASDGVVVCPHDE